MAVEKNETMGRGAGLLGLRADAMRSRRNPPRQLARISLLAIVAPVLIV